MTAADHANTVRGVHPLSDDIDTVREKLQDGRISLSDAHAAFDRIIDRLDPFLAVKDARKIEAYDAARAKVKREGLSRAELILRVEAAEQAAEQARNALQKIADVIEAWDNDETPDEDYSFDADMDFLNFIGRISRAALGNNT